MMRIALVPGDGVGSEVLQGPVHLVAELARLGHPIQVGPPLPAGATALRDHGSILPRETVAACERADCILLGAVGEHPGIEGVARPELALIGLRQHFRLGISVRQVWRPQNDPLVIVRNLLGGAYVADVQRTEGDDTTAAVDPFTLEAGRIRDVVEAALKVRQSAPSGQVYSVDKANLLATSRLWRRVVSASLADAQVPVRHVLVDRFAFELAKDLVTSGIVVTEGLFGDILSDLAAARAGSIALCSSASISERPLGGMIGLFEPVHGSAPRLAGRGIANPTGSYLALAAAMEWFPEMAAVAGHIRAGLAEVMDAGIRTYDMAASPDAGVPTVVFSEAVTDAVLRRVVDLPQQAGSLQTREGSAA